MNIYSNRNSSISEVFSLTTVKSQYDLCRFQFHNTSNSLNEDCDR